MNAPKISLRIESILTDQPGLSRKELQAALHREISTVIAEQGPAALGQSAARASSRGTVSLGASPLSARVASATLKAVMK